MPIAMLVENPRVTEEIYEQVKEHMGLDEPAGGYLHIAGQGPNGWRVIELWDSEQEALKFFREKLGPALAAAGVQGGPPTPQFWPVHTLMTAGVLAAGR